MAWINRLICCALGELANISDKASPKEALQQVCAHNWNNYTERLNRLPKFVIFSGVVKVLGHGEAREMWAANSAYKGKTLNYGQRFAAYLEKNELGWVDQIAEGYNQPGHPNHLVRVWLWEPDHESLSEWWNENS